MKIIKTVFSTFAVCGLLFAPALRCISVDAAEYREQSLEFSAEADAESFATTNAGWRIEDGVFKASDAWANAYPDFKIPLDEAKDISFDFCLADDDLTSHEFRVGLTSIQGENIQGGLTLHFYYSQWGNIITLSSEFSSRQWIADCAQDFFDGQTHILRLRIENKMVSFYIDGTLLAFQINGEPLAEKEIALEEAYLLIQATSTEYYIDNLRISDTLIDYPTSRPDPSGDSAAENENGEALTPTTGSVVRSERTEKGCSASVGVLPCALSLLAAGGVLLKKKKQ